MALSKCMLCVALVIGFLILSTGTIGVAEEVQDGMASREELDNKYLLTGQIIDLRTQVSDLEAAAKGHEVTLKRKDKKIRSLEKELKRFQNLEKAAEDVESKLAESIIKITDLDLEVSKLKSDLDESKVQNVALHKRLEQADSTIQLHSREKEKLAAIVAEHKEKLRKAERYLQIAESGLLKAQSEAAAKASEMAKSADAWLPPWAATQAGKVQFILNSKWSTHGQPAVKKLRQTASTKAAQAQKFAKPYIKKFNKNVRPAVQSQWRKVKTTVSPHLATAKKLGSEYFDASKKYLAPHLSKVQESIYPFVQTVKERSQPYVDQAANFLSPHLEKANTIAGPYVKKANDHYQSVVMQAAKRHEELQDVVKGTMGKHEVLARWATKELIWFLASAVLALPVLGFLLVFSSVIGSKKPTKRRRSPGSHRSSAHSGHKKSRRPKSVDKQEM